MLDFPVVIPSFNVICQVLLNLANQYANNEMYPEALNSYQVIVKNKMFSNAGEQTIDSPVNMTVLLFPCHIREKKSKQLATTLF